jgi:hypothetical protein
MRLKEEAPGTPFHFYDLGGTVHPSPCRLLRLSQQLNKQAAKVTFCHGGENSFGPAASANKHDRSSPFFAPHAV